MKYLGYKISGGLGHMLYQINHGVTMSKNSRRTLIIDTNAGAFKLDFNDYFTIPNLEYLTHTSKDLPPSYDSKNHAKLGPTPQGKQRYKMGDSEDLIQYDDTSFLSKPDEVVYFSYMTRGIQSPNFEIKIAPKILAQLSKQKITTPYIGVHYRNTDKKTDFNSIKNEIIKASTSSNIKNIYLATDDGNAFEAFKNDLGKNYNVFRYTVPFSNGCKNVHYGNPNKHEVTMNSLIDIYNLHHANVFIPSSTSSFSRLVKTNMCEIIK